MSPSSNTLHWLERLRTEVAAIADAQQSVVWTLWVAELELANGLVDAARTTLVDAMQRFDCVHPGSWTSLVYRAGELCGRLLENQLLDREVDRGLAWLASDPEIVKYQTALPERVHNAALQAGRADVARDFITDEWPGRAANQSAQTCLMAGWKQDAAELRRLLPAARAAISAAQPAPNQAYPFGYSLVRACVWAGLLPEAAEICDESAYPSGATDELVIALWREADHSAYARIRDAWLQNRIDAFRATAAQFHWSSWDVQLCAETIRRLGDADGCRKWVHQFHEVVAAWTPTIDWIACSINCDLAILCNRAGDAHLAEEYLRNANRLFQKKVPGVTYQRGGVSTMASLLSNAYRTVGDTDLAIRFAKRISAAEERRAELIAALIAGGRIPAAEAELAKLDPGEERATKIAHALSAEFNVGFLRVITFLYLQRADGADQSATSP